MDRREQRIERMAQGGDRLDRRAAELMRKEKDLTRGKAQSKALRQLADEQYKKSR